MKLYRVKSGFTFPRNREHNVFYGAGEVFSADEREVKPYLHMLEELKGQPKGRRGKPPGMRHTAILRSPEDRSMA